MTLTLYSPAFARAAPEIRRVTVREAPRLTNIEDGLIVAVASPDVVKLNVSFVLPVFVTRTV